MRPANNPNPEIEILLSSMCHCSWCLVVALFSEVKFFGRSTIEIEITKAKNYYLAHQPQSFKRVRSKKRGKKKHL
jgi:hypothetical protein